MSARHVLISALCGLAGSAPALAADGLLDPAFGYNGRSYLYWGHTSPAYDYANAMAVQDNGDILLVGNIGDHVFGCNGNTTSIGVSRLRVNGQFDVAFGAVDTPGQIVIPANNCWRHLEARAVAVQNDGRIVIAGSITDPFLFGGTRAAVWRLLWNGNLDPSFGNGGMATLPRAASLAPDDRATSIVVNDRQHPSISPGYAVVAGSVSYGVNGNRDALAFVLTDTGALASDFGNWTDPDGTRYYRLHFSSSEGSSDSQILALDYAYSGVWRFYAAGYVMDTLQRPVSTLFVLSSSLNPVAYQPFTFNPAGEILDTPSLATSIAIDRRTQRLWIGGTATPTGTGMDAMGVAALTYAAQYDTTVLGGNGRELIDFSSGTRVGHARANGIALQRDGRVVLAGSFYWDSLTGDARAAAVRLFDYGALDAGFGDFSASLPGVQAFQFPIGGASAETGATGIALAPHTDAIYLGGWTHNYAVPGSYYYAAAQLTDDTIFYDDFE